MKKIGSIFLVVFAGLMLFISYNGIVERSFAYSLIYAWSVYSIYAFYNNKIMTGIGPLSTWYRADNPDHKDGRVLTFYGAIIFYIGLSVFLVYDVFKA